MPESAAITKLPVENVGTLLHVRGKPQVFTDEENAVLRDALRDLRKRLAVTQTELARRLGVKQQTMSNLLGPHRAGMSRPIANGVARALGFRDVEDLLIERGVFAELKEVPSGKAWGNRDTAIRIARLLRPSFESAAIEAVIARYTTPTDRTRPIKWWLGRFADEERELALQRAEGQNVPAPPASRPSLTPSGQPARRRTRKPA